MNDAPSKNVSSEWTPPAGVVRHSGEPIQPNAMFFVPPPLEIGEVRTAETDCAQGARQLSTNARLLLVAVASVGGAISAHLICRDKGIDSQVFINAASGVAAVGAAVLAWFGTALRKTCSYVGTEGVAWFVCQGATDFIVDFDLLRFDVGLELRVVEKTANIGTSYARTEFRYYWTDSEFHTGLDIGGQHRNRDGVPPKGNQQHLARAAENAWSDWLLPIIRHRVEAGEEAVFRGFEGDQVSIRRGRVVVLRKNREYDFAIEEIGGVRKDNGRLSVRLKDASEGLLGVGRTGIHELPYEEVANARVLIRLLNGMMKPEPNFARVSGH